MKNFLLNLFTGAFLCYVQRLAIVFVFLLCVVCAYAGGSSGGNTKWSRKVTISVDKVTGTGEGFVYVSTNASTHDSKSSVESEVTNSSNTVNFYLYAEPAENYVFSGWYTDLSGSTPAANINNPSGNSDNVTKTYTEDGDDISETYYAKFSLRDNYIVRLKAAGHGIYEVKRKQNGMEQSIIVGDNDEECSNLEDLNIVLKVVSEEDGYEFLRWVITKEGETPSYSYNREQSYSVNANVEISVDFVSNSNALFIVKDDVSKSYFKFSEVIKAAKESSVSNVIVLARSGILYPETMDATYFDASSNKYTIPSGVTFLIPNGDTHVVYMGKATSAQVSTVGFSEKKYLIVENDQDFDIYGDVCIYANFVAGTGAICQYGRLHLGGDSHFVLKSGARLNALGYITGHTNSSVELESGANVQEIIQMADWRGGNATSTMVMSDGRKNRVFPINQYYVQNIETKLILHYGAVSNVTSLVKVSSYDFPVSATFISPKDGNYTGMFRIKEGAFVTRYYDELNDRIKYDFSAEDGATMSEIYLDAVTLNLEAEADGLSGLAASAILATMGLSEISSDQYILPVNNNMDIHIGSGVTGYVQNDLAFLAGSTLKIDKGASGKTIDGASVYVYDAEEHHVKYTDATINQAVTAENGVATNTSIIQNYYYNYFGAGSAPICKVANRPGGVQYNREVQDLVVWTNPNDANNVTKLQKTDATIILNGTFEGAIYTTKGGASIISDDPTANAVIKFDALATSSPIIKQVIQKPYNTSAGGDQEQKIVYPIIPCNPSATLLNADGTYSAGEDCSVENGRTYTYYPFWDNGEGKAKGKWSHELPDGVLTPFNLIGNNLLVTLPTEKTCSVTFTPQAKAMDIKSLKSVTFTNGRFKGQGTATYDNGVVTIPMLYSSTITHGDNITEESGETVTVEFNCYNPYESKDEILSVIVNLTATQDYEPKFLINDKADETITLNFGAIEVGQSSSEQTIKVSSIADNVTDRTYNNSNGYVTWTPMSLSATSPFEIIGNDYFGGVKVVYKPISTLGNHTQTLTLKATYADGVETTKQIVLQGTPILANNSLELVADQEIYPGDEIDPLFKSVGNGTPITFTYNGEDSNDIVEIISKENGDYYLRVKSGVNIVTTQVVTISVQQAANDVTGAGSDEIVVTVVPSVQWKWSKLYFGNTYDNPIVVKNEDEWTLTYNGGCGSIPIANFTKEATSGYRVVVGSGDECAATFTFQQGDYTYTFESAVYADPRLLDVCLRDGNVVRTFEDITMEKTNVRFENGSILFATTETEGAAWTMELIGVPDKLEFIPQGDGKRWSILEYDGINWVTTYTEAEISLAANQIYYVHNLRASTKQIRIICSSGAVQGEIKDLCVHALSVSADVDRLYLPIQKDEQNQIVKTQKMMLLSYVSPASDLKLSVVDESGEIVDNIRLSSTNLEDGELPATAQGDAYTEESILITSTYPTECVVYLLVNDKNNNELLKMPIRLFNYPQPLPIRTIDWKDNDAEKYYFYTNLERCQNVHFDNVTQKITFSPSGNNQSYITFVFRGGPSYISFETESEVTLQSWYDTWVLQVTADGKTYYSIAADAESEIQPEIMEKVREGKKYYQVRVAIPYLAKSLTLQRRYTIAMLENIVIDGDADLDVVLGNYSIEHETEANFSPKSMEQDVVVTAINLEQLKIACNNPHFTVKYGEINIGSTPIEFTSNECPNVLGNYMVGDIALNVVWDGVNMVEEGVLIFSDKDNNVLATIRLLGAKDFILKGNSQETGLFSGFATNITSHPFVNDAIKYHYERRQVNLSNAFDENGVALFDYLIVYGETTADDLGNTITTPTTTSGSNANTPVYIYRKAQNEGVYDRYEFVYEQANVNQGEKVKLHEALDGVNKKIPHAAVTDGTQYINIAENEQLRIYMTGFCPYASIGFEKTQEGVWLFRAKKNAKLDIYLEDCHIYSRNKTEDGHTYNGKDDPGASIFQEDYARGSGGVLVFECNQEGEYSENEAFQVTIHTRGNNLLKSNHGSFYEIFKARAFQVSSPVQIRLTSNINYKENSKTHLTFDDKWPINAADFTKFKRTNGFLSLQKQANNAPSIDLGNGNTVVNFRGGQVELQNAQNVSDKYKTTLAISYRSGIMAAGGAEIQMAYGIGTDAATEGRVNFYDGTITVIPMEVDSKDRKYYLMDKDEQGNELSTTSCLRCPEKTYVYGGSICMLRACMSPTSQGGAPTDGVRQLGRFVYTAEHGYEYNTANKQQPTNRDDAAQWLVNPKKFPSDITLFEGLANYHQNEGKYTYGIESVTPNEAGELILWIPDGFGGVEAEQDRYLTAWKACMPQITAVLAEVGITTIGGTVGGSTSVENIEDVTNLLYCQLDENVYDVISEPKKDVNGNEIEGYAYEAPLKVPDGFKMDGVDLGIGDYMRLAPSVVGPQDEHKIENNENYNINGKVYYISSATADVWQTFTAPFDVEKIWVVETYDEASLEEITLTEEDGDDVTRRKKILKTQARHNADFAAFFGVAMALGSEQEFEEIYEDYLAWAVIEDNHEGDIADYTKRGKYELIPYDGTNWRTANFYLNLNKGNWILDQEADTFKVQWEIPTIGEDGILLHKDSTYSMLFPYCVGCDLDENGELIEERDYWDYWSGKFIIFESTQATKENPHVMRGSNYVSATRPTEGEWIFANDEELFEFPEVIVTGNSTFAYMKTSREDVFTYTPDMNLEAFYPFDEEETIAPTTAFLYGYVPTPENASVMSISRMGKIKYRTGDNNGDDTPTGGEHVPTVGGGSDIFVTSVAEGINISVSEPQYVGVFSATGALLYNGWVETSVDVNLVVNGVYVVVGENNSVKVIY